MDTLRRLWEREAALGASALLLDCEQVEAADTARAVSIARWIEQISSPLLVSCRERRPPLQRPLITLEVGKPNASEQCSLWQAALGARATTINGQLEVLVSQFNLSTSAIQAACAEALGEIQATAPAAKPANGEPRSAGPAAELPDLLWQACR